MGVLHRILLGVHSSLMTLDSQRTLRAALIAAGVALAILIADYLGLSAPYWAGLTAMVISMPADMEGIFRKALHRFWGTCLGALVGIVLFVWWQDSFFLLMLGLFAVLFCMMWFAQGSKWSYAWILGGATCLMVLLGGVFEPEQVVKLAIYRPTEITLGIVCMLLVHGLIKLIWPQHAAAKPAAGAAQSARLDPSDRFWKALSPALAGSAVLFLSLGYDLPGGLQSVISVLALALTGSLQLLWHKGLQRFGGCLLGGLIGLFFTTWSVESLLGYICVVCVASWLFSVINLGHPDASYLGFQAEIGFLVSFSASSLPTEELSPAILRLSGIVIGMAVILLIEYLLFKLRRQLA